MIKELSKAKDCFMLLKLIIIRCNIKVSKLRIGKGLGDDKRL
ncbi:hypothetical protein HMPREF0077_0792 [Anaerococcus tetradius ATCC 35098]|uniref:Uncharacterized protein n=2 Tax=Anaerococcus tetradius TaxID=33036 RepID=C2CH32_9FIRM|nr:hypothetical protein HMPREF0077_0792 [Anaerococcus tetradius ATCC 35098]KWZ77947.1 hypothetical protein HMPREF3200_00995 [Anaerococcus tetradius]